MSDKLSAVQARIAGVHELETVVGAMRGIAAARSREARSRLEGIRACAEIVGAAIGAALSLEPRNAATSNYAVGHAAHLMIIFCAEQGFVGSFNDHLAAAAIRATHAGITEYFVIGGRGAAVFAESGLKIAWSAAMVAHADEVGALAGRITAALYERIEAGKATQVSILHAVPEHSTGIEIVERLLLPFDFQRFANRNRHYAPLVTLPPQQLLAKLAEEYIYAQLCEAIMLSFAAENEARMRAMIAARSNVHTTLNQLIGSFRRLRQEEITADIVELSAGSLAADGMRRKPRLRE